jgi:hypothetical protein
VAADNQASGEAGDSASNSGGLLGAFLNGVARVWNAVTEDGYLAAAGRQGLGELGQALKAFPDSIQVQEPGTIFNPTQGEIAADRETSSIGPPHPWPSEIADGNRNQPVNDNGNDFGKEGGYSM